ncbi:Csu type fimbrial protein [Pedomonas mirosovicensis]|uniref:Csu type fimbrial protein n=1 Tax=Pedomonas mirosovicensis TaxID=2908641 RepID=UPI0021691A31|nr:spore coat U domain-containing protein [Pedomonas mirosovicensis]MCH8685062.1 spore coat U domain-containing protein [Pedomonas mirosovicensis]
MRDARKFAYSNKALVALCGAALMLGVAGSANAATGTNNLTVNATVASTCTVSAGTIDFGSFDVTDATAEEATGTVNVKCTNGTPWTLYANAGAGQTATVDARRMTGGAAGTDTLQYQLYTDTYTTAWGDGVSSTVTGAFTGTGTGVDQTQTIYGRIPAGQTASGGGYTDTVVMTVSY